MNRVLLIAALALNVGLDLSEAHACGGFFCNALDPVNQAGEQILFARDGEQIEMHVQINYQGPAVDFGWILPAAPDVETTVSTEALFTRLNGAFRPQMRANYTYDPACPMDDASSFVDGGIGFLADGSAPPPDPEPTVNVLSREAVGPYDRVILQADDTEVLFEWLNQNDFAIPMDAAERLGPYIDTHVFVAIKLLAGNDSDDIKPLKLRYTAAQPTIPLRPTAVAAQPDMPIVVYILGAGRAVTLNYLHVEINETLINWVSGGTNYPVVAAHAIDQAGGQAFVTDFAGPHMDRMAAFEVTVDLNGLRDVRTLNGLLDYAAALRSPDLIKLVRAAVAAPEGVDVDDVLRQPFDYDAEAIMVDGAGLVAAIEADILPVYDGLNALFEAHPKLTRLYTTMNAEEMTTDPLFDWNIDLPDVPNVRTAEIYVTCSPLAPGVDAGSRIGEVEYRITTPSGIEYRSGSVPTITRQEGVTVRGMEAVGAALVEQQMPAGQSELDVDNRPMIEEMSADSMASGAGADDDASCGCNVSEAPMSPLVFLGVLAVLGIRRRLNRRRRDP